MLDCYGPVFLYLLHTTHLIVLLQCIGGVISIPRALSSTGDRIKWKLRIGKICHLHSNPPLSVPSPSSKSINEVKWSDSDNEIESRTPFQLNWEPSLSRFECVFVCSEGSWHIVSGLTAEKRRGQENRHQNGLKFNWFLCFVNCVLDKLIAAV